YRKRISWRGQEFLLNGRTLARQRKDLNPASGGALQVVQYQRAAALTRCRLFQVSRNVGGLMWQDLPGQMDVVFGIGDVQIAVKFYALKQRTCSAQISAVERPVRQLARIHSQPHVELGRPVSGHGDGGRRRNRDGPADRVVRITKLGGDRVGSLAG